MEDNVILPNDIVVGPNSIVRGEVPRDSLYVRNRVLEEQEGSKSEKVKNILTRGL